MSQESHDLEPTLAEIRGVLALFVEVSRSDSWCAAIAMQVEHVVGVEGPYWNTKLIIEGEPPLVPRGTPIPLNRKLDTRPGVEPDGTLLLWVDDKTGIIDSVELATYTADTISRYPAPSDLTAWP